MTTRGRALSITRLPLVTLVLFALAGCYRAVDPYDGGDGAAAERDDAAATYPQIPDGALCGHSVDPPQPVVSSADYLDDECVRVCRTWAASLIEGRLLRDSVALCSRDITAPCARANGCTTTESGVTTCNCGTGPSCGPGQACILEGTGWPGTAHCECIVPP